MTCSNSSSGTSSATCCETLEKYVYEEKWFEIDCTNVLGDETVESSPVPTVTSTKYNGDASDLTISDITVTDTSVRFFITGGTANTRYKLTLRFESSGGQKFQAVVLLRVL